MITGRLQEKNARYYMILNIKDEFGKYKPKWVSTGLPIRGNKKNADVMLRETLAEYEIQEATAKTLDVDNPLFSDYIQAWLKSRRKSIQPNTYTSYRQIILSSIVPYFENLGITLLQLKPEHISTYYFYLMDERGNGANTVKHHHANIRKALNQAFIQGRIPGNPADKVELPRAEKTFHGDFYDADEMNVLFKECSNHRLEPVILVAAFYGLRRSEVLGLRWKSINFKNKTITISHVLTEVVDDAGHRYLQGKDRTKNITSLRILPLVPQVERVLLETQKRQVKHKRLCGKAYCKEYLDYVFVDSMGSITKPNYVTQSFKELLAKQGLRHIRFHDLRHSCASLLLANGVDLKRIQEWLGHASIETTSKYYGHLKFESKIESANVIDGCLNMAK